jgi:AMP-activated protein kinase-like protein
MRRHVSRAIGLAIGLTVTNLSSPLAAQDWHLSAQAGRIRSVLDPASAASESFALGLRFDDPNAGLRVSAGIPGNSNEALWGSIGGWKRLAPRFGGFRAGIDVAGNAFLTMDRGESNIPVPGPLHPPGAPVTPSADRTGHALAGQALPVVGYESLRWQVHARAGLSRYASEFSAQRRDRFVRLADVQVTLMPASAFAFVPVVQRYAAAGEKASTYAGVSAIAASSLGMAWGSIGQWSADDAGGTPWSAGGRLRLHPLIALELGARHDAFDPLYLQPAQTSWSMGLSLKLGGRAHSVRPPVPAAYVDGRATIKLPVSASKEQPSIAGDFNNWKPVPMQRSGDHWTYMVALVPGVYNYAFVTAGGEWFVPETVAGRKSDGMGGHVAVLVVR